MTELTDNLLNRLKSLAADECWGDELFADDTDTYVDDYAGGNVDDAFSGGERTGEVMLARDILDELGIEY